MNSKRTWLRSGGACYSLVMKLRWSLSLLACSSLVSCSDDSTSSQGGSESAESTSTTATSGTGTATTGAEDEASTSAEADSDSTTTSADPGETSGSSSETGSDTGQDSGGLGELPTPPDNAGVVYVAHFESSDLRWYRIDGASPREAGRGSRRASIRSSPGRAFRKARPRRRTPPPG